MPVGPSVRAAAKAVTQSVRWMRKALIVLRMDRSIVQVQTEIEGSVMRPRSQDCRGSQIMPSEVFEVARTPLYDS